MGKKKGLDSIIMVKQEIAESMIMEAENSQLVNNLDNDPLGLDNNTSTDPVEGDNLSIQEFSDDQKSENEFSEGEVEKILDSADLEAEIRNINQHLCGKLESMISYPKDKPWKRYVGDAETTLKLNLKLIEKIYYR